MASERIQKLRRIYGIALSCVIIVAGICLMAACVSIYRSGDEPYSREAVAAAFAPISIPVYLCLAMVVAGFVLKLLFPAPAKKAAAPRQYSVMLKRLHDRVDPETCGSELWEKITAEQALRKRNARICALVLVAAAAVFLIYALNSSHFHSSDINGSMVRAMYLLVPCLVVAFLACILTVSARQKSMLREMELLKQCPKAETPRTEVPKAASSNKVRYVLLLAGIALAVFGFCAGGTADVLTKAVNICTECIGLG